MNIGADGEWGYHRGRISLEIVHGMRVRGREREGDTRYAATHAVFVVPGLLSSTVILRPIVLGNPGSTVSKLAPGATRT